jgi:hypothetical protein
MVANHHFPSNFQILLFLIGYFGSNSCAYQRRGASLIDHPVGAGSQRADRFSFDRHVRLEFRGAQISADCGLQVMRELDDALGWKSLTR